jgi:hypothetical protein
LVGVAALLGAALVVPTLSAGGKDKEPAKTTAAETKKADPFDTLAPPWHIEVVSVDTAKKTWKVYFFLKELDPKVVSQLEQLQKSLKTAEGKKETATVTKLQKEIAQLQKALHTYAKKEVTMPLPDESILRRPDLPVVLDPTGKPVTFTPEEIQQLKGSDPKAPGYTTTWSMLTPNSYFTLNVTNSNNQSAAKTLKAFQEELTNTSTTKSYAWWVAGYDAETKKWFEEYSPPKK